MSGTYNLLRFLKTENYTEDYFVSSPLQFVPTLAGPHLGQQRGTPIRHLAHSYRCVERQRRGPDTALNPDERDDTARFT